jgi:Lrp/AsnC family transcriptional regulator, regulator for asnA, asnC and gidA
MGLLQGNGRASHAMMARELSVGEGTIRRRLAGLLKDGGIRVVAVADPEQIGYHTSAFVGLEVDPHQVEAAVTELEALRETELVAITTGSFDIFISVHLSDSEALASFLHQKVGPISGVRRTETFVSLQTHKSMLGPVI